MQAELNVDEWKKAADERAKTYSAMKTAEATFAEKKKAYETASAQCRDLLSEEKKRGRKAVGASA